MQVHDDADPPTPLAEEKYSAEEKKNNELLRRWKVKIFQIEVLNTSGQILDPFGQFIIGGTFFVSVRNSDWLVRDPQGLERQDAE